MMHAEGYSAVTLVLLVTLARVMGNNFPPVENPPSILAQGVKSLDIPPSNSYIQEQVVNKGEDVLIPGSFKNDKSLNSRFLADALNSEQLFPPQDTFEQYYANGYSAIGPVATPRPDGLEELYPAQISKGILPPEPSSGYWVIDNGQEPQFPKGVSSLKVSEVSSLDSVKSVPQTVISSNTPSDQPGIKQVWVTSPEELPKSYSLVDGELRPQLVDVPFSGYKHIAVPEATKDYVQPLPPPVSKYATTIPKSVGNVQQLPFSVSDLPIGDLPDNAGWLITKDGTVSQVRHIWIPTSKDTGQFITVPKGGVVGSQTITPKAVPQDVASETWVLKQDDAYPRFEQQLNPLFPVPADGKPLEKSSIPKDGSSKVFPAVMRTIPWIIKPEAPDVNVLNQAAQPWPINSAKSGTIFVNKGQSKDQQVFLPPVKAIDPPPPPVAQVVKKPCPITTKAPVKNVIITPPARTLVGFRRPILTRIVRFSNSPNSYYILNPTIRRPVYQYRRPVGTNTVLRIIPSQVPRSSIVVPRTPMRLVYSPYTYNRLNYMRSPYSWSQPRSFPFTIPTLFNALASIPTTAGSEASSSSSESTDTSQPESEPQVSSVETAESSEVEKVASTETEAAQVVAETVLNVQTADQNDVQEGSNMLEDSQVRVDEPSADVDTLGNTEIDILNDLLQNSAENTGTTSEVA